MASLYLGFPPVESSGCILLGCTRRYPLLSARSRHGHHYKDLPTTSLLLSLSPRCLNSGPISLSSPDARVCELADNLPPQRHFYLRRPHRCRHSVASPRMSVAQQASTSLFVGRCLPALNEGGCSSSPADLLLPERPLVS